MGAKVPSCRNSSSPLLTSSSVAAKVEATHLIRGIRNNEDFGYETQMALVNRKIAPGIKTVYMAPPPELSEVSSSTVRGLVGFTDWEHIVKGYVHPTVLRALAENHARSQTARGKLCG